jgi:hypothetical protein
MAVIGLMCPGKFGQIKPIFMDQWRLHFSGLIAFCLSCRNLGLSSVAIAAGRKVSPRATLPTASHRPSVFGVSLAYDRKPSLCRVREIPTPAPNHRKVPCRLRLREQDEANGTAGGCSVWFVSRNIPELGISENGLTRHYPEFRAIAGKLKVAT